MISRKTSNSRQYVETLQQTSFVGSAGINTKASPTSSNTLLDITNFDIEADGSLALRKSLIKKNAKNFDDVFLEYIFDKNYYLCIKESFSIVGHSTVYEVYVQDVQTKAYTRVTIRYSPITSEGYMESLTLSGDLSNLKIINTVTTTILTNVKVSASAYNLTNTEDSINNNALVYRYLRLFKEDSEWILEIINPEINEFTSVEAAVLNPNLTLDYAYALRDNYNAANVGVTNILAYAITDTSTEKPSVNSEASFSGYTIEQLTEKVTGISPRILSTIKKDANFPVCLKAFVNVKPTEDAINYVCIWEKTYNGVDWLEVPEFVDNDCVLVELPDPTAANESLSTSGTYKTLKNCKIFNPKSNQDLVINRPDCLILNSFDTATYRFSIYSLKTNSEDKFWFYKTKISANFKNIEKNNNNVYIYDYKTLSNISPTETTFQIIFESSTHLETLDKSKFKIKIVCKNGETYFYENDSLSYFFDKSEDTYAKHTFTFYLKKPALYNFYDSTPMLIKVYFENTVLYTFKFILNRFITLNFTTLTSPVNPTWTVSEYEEVPGKDGRKSYVTIPKTKDLLDAIEYYNTYYLGIPYLTPEYFVIVYDNVKNLAYNTSIETEFTFSNLEHSTFNVQIPEPAEGKEQKESLVGYYSLTNSYVFLKSKSQKIIVFQIPDSITEIKTMEDYKTIYSLKQYVGLNEIYEDVDFTAGVDVFEEPAKEVQLTLGFQQFTFIFANETEFVYSDIPNTVQGEKLYYKKAIYTYGKEFKNNIFPTYIDSFITPLFNVIDLDTTGSSYVTTLVPWRDYLIAATENTVHLITRDTEGYYTKTVNSFIGIPWEDRKTCKSILNGILFKSGSKVYTLSPNAYSGDDTMLNISEISGPIEGLIPETKYDNFAISTEKAYYLFIPDDTQTVCFKYDFVRKLWTKFVYPVRFVDYKIISVDDIRLFSEDKEFYFEKTLKYLYPDVEHLENVRYGDYLEFTDADIKEYNGDSFVTPIEYRLDSGQKTDNISFTKQFTESKILLATLNERYVFPFSLDINIDGTLRTIHKDANTDGSLWKTSDTAVGAIGMTLTTSNTDNFNIIRQMYVRFSGKGKSIQHILSGVSYFNFKFYMVYYRYRLLNVKQ